MSSQQGSSKKPPIYARHARGMLSREEGDAADRARDACNGSNAGGANDGILPAPALLPRLARLPW